MARVSRPVDAPCGATCALFTSRRAAPDLLDYYQCPILNCGNPVVITDDLGTKPREYYYFPEGTSQSLRLEGPTRLRLEARLKYGLEAQQRQTFWIQIYVNGVLHRVLSMDTSPERQHRTFVDGCERLVGRREFAYVDLDCGESAIEIRSSQAAYLRADAVSLNLCRNRMNRTFPNPSWQNGIEPRSIWDARLDPTSSALSQTFLDGAEAKFEPTISGQPLDPYLNLPAIRALARNNRIRHSGVHAYLWIRAIASLHYGEADYGDEIDVVDLANRIRGRYTYFRDLLPATLDAASGPRVVAFGDHQIRRPSQRRTETVVGQQHIADAIGWLPTTTLVRLSQAMDEPLTYQVPDSLGTSLLRLVVDQSALKGRARLLVQYDDRPPIELEVQPNDAVKPAEFLPGIPAAALSSLATTHAPYDSGTGGGPFAMWEHPRHVVCAATAEFLKPADVKQIQITLLACDNPSIHIGVQLMDGGKVRLSETELRQLTAISTHEKADSAAFDFASAELENNSFTLERLLTSHHQTFLRSVERSDQVDTPTDLWDADRLNTLDQSARQLVAARQLPEAIDLLTKIINHSTGQPRRRAILDRAAALVLAGEEFLANREMRGWLKYSDDPELRLDALRRLLELDIDNPLLREQYLAFAAIQFGTPEIEIGLARQLMDNGRYQSALLALRPWSPTI